jgi:hypothetical protein
VRSLGSRQTFERVSQRIFPEELGNCLDDNNRRSAREAIEWAVTERAAVADLASRTMHGRAGRCHSTPHIWPINPRSTSANQVRDGDQP